MMCGHIDHQWGQIHFFKEHLNLALQAPGDLAEFGCFEGGTSRLMAQISGRHVHLFDSFKGLPELGAKDERVEPTPNNNGGIVPGAYCAQRRLAELAMAGFPHSIYEGWFSETAPKLQAPLAFAHVDCDLYESAKDAIACCERLLHPDGRIILHDCCGAWGLTGMKAAMDEALGSGRWIVLGMNKRGPGQVALGPTGPDRGWL